MEHEAVFQVGAAAFTGDDIRHFAFYAIIGLGVALAPGAWWHLRDWRIRRARSVGKDDIADILALDHDEEDRPKSLASAVSRIAIVVIGLPALIIFQQNFAAELEHLLGEGWGFAAMLLTVGFLTACAWMWDRIKRNAMSPEELAELEEEEEYRRWLDGYLNGSTLSPIALYIIFLAIILGIVALLML
tara:strand:+ start:68 stop:631 length:564 start_codon:yes stop_codon:yes gene_type:complete